MSKENKMNQNIPLKISHMIEAYLNDELDEAAFTELESWLGESNQNVEAFAQSVFMHQQLRETFMTEGVAEMLGTENPVILDLSISNPASLDTTGLIPNTSNAPITTSPTTFFGPWSFPIAFLLLIGLFTAFGLVRHFGNIGPQDGKSEVSSFQYNSGIAKLTLANVGTVIIDGPSDFQMLNPMRGRLSKGKIKVRVSEESGHGFQIETPSGLVTDLGTEFLLNVSDEGKTDVAVLEGMVDLQVSKENQKVDDSPTQRLVQGDGVNFDGDGNIDRIMSITRGNAATFHTAHELSEKSLTESNPLIASVRDNLPASDTKRFYEIVPGGFNEDAKAFVDRNYEWNGVNQGGIPKVLRGADYIMTYNDDKKQQISITLALSRAATVYVLFDNRGPAPDWLIANFKKTEMQIGMDEGPSSFLKQIENPALGKGPGVSIDYRFSVWSQEVMQAGAVELGSRGPGKIIGRRSMYGIVVVPFEEQKKTL